MFLENTRSLPRPFFLPSRSGRVFCVYHEPVGDTEPWGNLLVVPALNEEMNRCRSMVTIQAQALAQLGVGTMVIDLYGTGESDGNYGDARWESWLEDVNRGIDWLNGRPGGCIALLGIRLGFLLTVSVLRDRQENRALIAWQPVVDGKAYFTQFMRMKIAANMDRTDIPKETTADMRAKLAAGCSIEIAGYEIHPELAMTIESLKLAELILPRLSRIAWFEKTSGLESVVPTGIEKLIEDWRLAGNTAELVAFQGPAFWALHERSVAPELVKKTVDWLMQIRLKK